MPLPIGVQSVTLTGGTNGLRAPDGTPYAGTVTLTPSVARVVSPAHGVIVLGPSNATLGASGGFTLGPVLATDADGFTPTGWTYRVDEAFTGQPPRSYSLLLPAATPVVALPDVTPVDAAPGTVVVLSVQSVNGHTGVVTGMLEAANNLSDVESASASRTALGLGNSATCAVGTTTGTVADGGDSRFADARTPSGAAGGALKGTYPNPQLADATVAAFDTAGAASAAQAAAIAAASTDATTKANTAQSAAISAAATDATAKANAAQAAAIAAIPAAASTVTTETAYGQSSATGTATTYARQDHTHGSPALTSTAPATTEGIGQAAVVGTASAPARADHVHPMAAAAAPHASAVGDTVATGAATTFAASDHVHAREGFGAVTAQTTYSAASANGSATTVARSDHAHGTPALPTPAAIGAYTTAEGADLAARVTNVEVVTTTLNTYITDALNRIASLETRMTNVEARVTALGG